jgi:hypothetical protein
MMKYADKIMTEGRRPPQIALKRLVSVRDQEIRLPEE